MPSQKRQTKPKTTRSKAKPFNRASKLPAKSYVLTDYLVLVALVAVFVYSLILGILYYQFHALGRARAVSATKLNAQADLLQQRLELVRKYATQNDLILDDQSGSEQKILQVYDLTKHYNYSQAADQLNQAQLSLGSAQIEFTRALHAKEQVRQAAQASEPAPKGMFLPILFYHKPPADFDSQMNQLAAKGYTAITMADVAKILHNEMDAPAKPVVITFDDGFSAQTSAMPSLVKHHFKATLYLIIAGERSHWCIGIERRPGNCGDSYLNWKQISQMLSTGLIEIGDHTVDHPSLPSLGADVQKFEIVSAKQRLEQMLGVSVTTFAYPYGSYNQTSIDVVRQAGFSTAVTTISGLYQTPENIFTLRRIRSVSQLP